MLPHFRKPFGAFLLLLVIAVQFCRLPAWAQGTSASLTGTVTDASGAAIAGASVKVVNTDTNYTSAGKTDATGMYLLRPLPIGHYRLTVEAANFTRYVQEGIELTVNLAATQNVSLKVSSSGETVTVTSNAELINTSSAELGTTISQAVISQLPLDGRDPSGLVLLAPGTVDAIGHGGESAQTGFSFPNETGASVGGGRQGSTFYMLDGVSNMDNYDLLTAPFPNSDATQEFKVLTSNFGAQYGFAPGAVVSIATKSGTNQFHGGAFWYVRNNAMNATDWFSGQADTLRRNQFGVFGGGPIKKDKLFIFGNYQGTKIVWNSTDTLTTTPTNAMLNGDFSGLASAADLASGTTDLNGPYETNDSGLPNQLDTSKATLDPASVYFAQYGMPRAATTLASNTATLHPGQQLPNGDMMYVYPTVHDSYDEGTLKVDYNFSPSQTITLRSFTNHFGSPSTDVPGNMESAYNHSNWTASFWQEMWYFNNLVQHTWMISPTTVNTISVFMNQMTAHSQAQELDSTGKAMCFSNVIAVNELPGSCYMGPLRINSDYGFESGWDEPSAEVRTTLGFTDTLNKTLGKHSLTAGIDLMHQHASENTQYPTQPMIGFGRNGTGSSENPYAGTTAYNGSLADYMMGYAMGYMQGAGEIADVAGWQIAPFVQDDWHILPNLTLNIGVRWDPITPPVSKNGRGAAFVPDTTSAAYTLTASQTSVVYPNAPAGLLFPGDPGVPDTLINSDYGYFEPRIGLAYQPKGLPHTVFHAGFGMFTGPLQYSEYNHAADVAPFSPTYNFSGWCWPCGVGAVDGGGIIPFDSPWSNTTVSPFSSSPFPGTFAWATVSSKPAKDVAISKGQQVSQVFSRNFKLPMTTAWNASIEQQLTPTTALRIAYVGNQTSHLSVARDLNPQYPNSPSSTAYTNPTVTRDASFSDIYMDESWATASYNALQLSVDHHIAHGLQLQSNFTWSHTIDIASSSNVSYGNPSLGNPYSAKWNRGNSNMDMPWAWKGNFVYQAPLFKNRGRLMAETVGGWQLSGIVNWNNGWPFSISSWTDPGVGLWNTRADAVSGVSPKMGKGSHWDWVDKTKGYFNTGAFTDPTSCNDATPGWCGFGDTGRNAYMGPAFFDLDASIMKNWTIKEGQTLQFRWDAFNAPNHPTFANPSSNVDAGSSTFGIVTGTNTKPRYFQGALRLTF